MALKLSVSMEEEEIDVGSVVVVKFVSIIKEEAIVWIVGVGKFVSTKG